MENSPSKALRVSHSHNRLRRKAMKKPLQTPLKSVYHVPEHLFTMSPNQTSWERGEGLISLHRAGEGGSSAARDMFFMPATSEFGVNGGVSRIGSQAELFRGWAFHHRKTTVRHAHRHHSVLFSQRISLFSSRVTFEGLVLRANLKLASLPVTTTRPRRSILAGPKRPKTSTGMMKFSDTFCCLIFPLSWYPPFFKAVIEYSSR